MSSLSQLYQESILDHHRRPRNSGRVAAATHIAEGQNPLCGDRLTLSLQIADDRIVAIACDAVGCAICRASGSLLTEAVVGRTVGEVALLVDRFLVAVAHPEGQEELVDTEWGPLAALFQVRRFPSRRRCATLSWEALRRAIGAA
jgi:nitrogen fixation protein NifU and related proteins